MMRPCAGALAAFSAVLIAAFPAASNPPAGKWTPKKSKFPQEQIDAAVEKGCKWLGGAGGDEELVAYTLFHGGVAEQEAIIQAKAKALLGRDPQKIYNTALAAMFISEIQARDKVDYRYKLADYAQFISDNQAASGQWGYGEPVRLPGIKPPEPKVESKAAAGLVQSGPGGGSVAGPAAGGLPAAGGNAPAGADPKAVGGGGTIIKKKEASTTVVLPRIPIKQNRRGSGTQHDNSNTQYAILGLRACIEGGIDVDERVLKDALQWMNGCQEGGGGWAYNPGEPPYGSMTAGGIGSVAILNFYLGKDMKGDNRTLKGIRWMGDNFALDCNPKATGHFVQFHYYYLYGLERAGMIYGTDFFGSHDWYDEGAEYLLKNQDPGGSWKGNARDTCFAILFLRRATRALPPKAKGPVVMTQ